MFIRLILSLFLLSFSLSSFGHSGDKSSIALISSHTIETAASSHDAMGHNTVINSDCNQHLSAGADCSTLCAFPSMMGYQISQKVLPHRLEKNFISHHFTPYLQYPEAPLRPPSVDFSFSS